MMEFNPQDDEPIDREAWEAYQRALEANGPPSSCCGAGMCEHGICENFCNNGGEPCIPCHNKIGADNMVIAERNASARAMYLFGHDFFDLEYDPEQEL